jgi:hypothetical protein
MAINLFNKYGSRANPPSIDYPQGSVKNRSAPEVKDGTPLDADWANDHQGFFQSILSYFGVTANGTPDKVGASQYFDALMSDPTEARRGLPTVATAAQVLAGAPGKMIDAEKLKAAFFPSVTGNATLTGSSNNVGMANLASAITLEKGDVIQITAGAYTKLHTVESLTNADNLVVNYEHCGARGNGTLKLPDYTGQVTIKRIAKWYNASEGLGQDWVNATAFRIPATDYTYSVPRTLKISAAAAVSGAGNVVEISQGTESVSRLSVGASEISTTQATVSGNSTYRGVVGSGSAFLRWKEFR